MPQMTSADAVTGLAAIATMATNRVAVILAMRRMGSPVPSGTPVGATRYDEAKLGLPLSPTSCELVMDDT